MVVLVENGSAMDGSRGWPPTMSKCVSVNTHWGCKTGIAFVDGSVCHDGGVEESTDCDVRLSEAKRGNVDAKDGPAERGICPPNT
jgi:hypothetical protein